MPDAADVGAAPTGEFDNRNLAGWTVILKPYPGHRNPVTVNVVEDDGRWLHYRDDGRMRKTHKDRAERALGVFARIPFKKAA